MSGQGFPVGFKYRYPGQKNERSPANKERHDDAGGYFCDPLEPLKSQQTQQNFPVAVCKPHTYLDSFDSHVVH